MLEKNNPFAMIFSKIQPNTTHNSPQEQPTRQSLPILHQTLSSSSFFNTKYNNLQQQKLSYVSIYNDQYCGCQQQIEPCKIINQHFIKHIPLKQMKKQYSILQQPLLTNQQYNHYKKLFNYLSPSYPQVYYTHIDNILSTLHHQWLSKSQFICLTAIHYHCKIEYITYYFYSDIKKAFNIFDKFMHHLEIALINENTTYQNIKKKYNNCISQRNWNQFIKGYYESIGSILVPDVQYAKLLKLIALKGKAILAILLSYLLNHQQYLRIPLRHLQQNQIKEYQQSIREIGWDYIFQSLLNIKYQH